MRIKRFLSQKVNHRPLSSTTDSYGNRGHGAAVVLRCRKEERQSVIRNRMGAEHVSRGTVLTIDEIQLGDLLDGYEVQARENFVDQRGKVIGWKSYL